MKYAPQKKAEARDIEESLRRQRDYYKKHVGPTHYNAIVKQMTGVIRLMMRRHKLGAYDCGTYLAAKLKQKDRLTDTKGHVISSAVYEIIAAQSVDSRIITA